MESENGTVSVSFLGKSDVSRENNGEEEHTIANLEIPGWFAEHCPVHPGQAIYLKMDKILFQGKSEYQSMMVFESEAYGKVFVLDGELQLTEKDECSYQEMITHLTLCSVANPKKVLLIGGGDGGILREISRHSTVEQIDICEIDTLLIDTYKKFFPKIAVGFDDERVTVHVRDGLEFLKSVPSETYDAIILDAFSPIKPGHELLDSGIFEASIKALRRGGVFCTQAESLWYQPFDVEAFASQVAEMFNGSAEYAWTAVPTYPSGMIGLMLCSSETRDFNTPINPIDPYSTYGVANEPLKFYNSQMHAAAFCLPNFAKSIPTKATDAKTNGEKN